MTLPLNKMSDSINLAGARICPLEHPHTALSVVTAVICSILFATTTTLNSLIIYIVLKDRRNKFKILFYKLLLNIAVADALTGLITDTVYVGIHVSEAYHAGLKPREVMVAHMLMFIFGGVSLITMIYLCIDRIFAITRPYTYRKGMSKSKSRLLIASSWCLSIMQASLYLVTGFMKYLVVFTIFNIALPLSVLVLTTVIYHEKLTKEHPNEGGESNRETSTLKRSTTDAKKGRKATKSFLKMLLVFIFSYVPACFITIYFNVCTVCDCLLINVLRDLAVLFILSGSLLRAINFLCSLTSLKKEAALLLGINTSENSYSESANLNSAANYNVPNPTGN